ncbi:hypothetical protein HWI77_05685 [Acinetobacter venetianus]|jgi:hypothetical protein|uniref:hypothetical protein n=1 Tax=Acinetobacter TaxID=469 RepID=UPI00178431D7|nr:hypothetical protein [Acinetobacter venetianus]QNH52248.1 hypothetical protein HWI77_05685 [Acinetobacter venetianus]
MDKYITSNSVCEMFKITKRTLNRWEIKSPWGLPFPAPVLKSDGGTMKRYLSTDVMEWEQKCSNLEMSQKAI